MSSAATASAGPNSNIRFSGSAISQGITSALAHTERTVTLSVAVPEGAVSSVANVAVSCRFADARLSLVEQRVRVHVLVPAELGNLLADGGFESAAKPGAWSIHGPALVAPTLLVPGLGEHVLRFAGNPGWQSAAQSLPLTGGQQYL